MTPAGSLESDDAVLNELISVVGNYTLDALLDTEQRRQHKELCAERLAAQDNVEVQYAEQAVLANLDWGMDALEEAIMTSNEETKKARLEHAEKMLQVSALLDMHHTTAGVPNSYLSAWAHLNLAFVWKLRDDDRKSAAHILEMFLVEPLYARVDFSPALWEKLFLPHLTSILAWYTEQRHQILSSMLPDGTDYSWSKDELSYNVAEYKSFLSTLGPEQALKLQHLERVYEGSLDENTRLYARYYKEWVNFDPNVTPKRNMPLMPIAEPPMTPTRELSHLPRACKFGPQPPTSAGFSHPHTGFSTVYTTSDNQVTLYCHNNFCLQPIWDADEESLASEGGVHLITYRMELPQVAKHSPFTDQSPGEHLSLQSLEESNPSASEHSGIGHRSPLDSQKPSKDNRKPFPKIHEERSHRTGSSNALSALFQDQDTVTNSSSWSSPVIKECSWSPKSRLQNVGDLAMGSHPTGHQEKNTIGLGAGRETDGKEEHLLQKDAAQDEGHQKARTKRRSKSRSVTQSPPGFETNEHRHTFSQPNFNDPVTLETGQTFERKAIQEWLDRGNTTCPITRQTLQSLSLPKTNYVLKRVIASWKEQHPELAMEYGSSDNSPCVPRTQQNYLLLTSPHDQSVLESSGSLGGSISPSSITSSTKSRQSQRTNGHGSARNASLRAEISQSTQEALIDELKPAVACLCCSDELQDCEAAIFKVARIWQESKGAQAIQVHLVQANMLKSVMEVLSISNNSAVLEAAIYILSELILRDESIAGIVVAQDPNHELVLGLTKMNILSSVVLLYQLEPPLLQSVCCDLLPIFLDGLHKCELDSVQSKNQFQTFLGPKEAVSLMIDQMLTAAEQSLKSAIVRGIISMDGLSPLVDSLEAASMKERISAVAILLHCMQVDGNSRSYIAHSAQLTPVLDLLHCDDERGRNVTILFLTELVRLSRLINNQLLQVIKEEGSLSTMHVLLVHLQKAPFEQRPYIAGLLLQLDLLIKPRKGSMYREDAIEALIEALSNKDMLSSQVAAAEMLVCLGSRFSSSGKSLLELFLLKAAGLEQELSAVLKKEQALQRPAAPEGPLKENRVEEEKACVEWERRVAGALVNFENGLIFETLHKGMKSQSVALSKPCNIASTWLVHMLPLMPDTGVQDKACKLVMPEYIRILKSSKVTEEKALAVLALHSFVNNSGLQEFVQRANDISGPLRQLRSSVKVASFILKKLISSPLVNVPELWAHEEIAPPIDTGTNGDVRCLAQIEGRLFSGHSDGSMKVWDCRNKNLILIQDLKEHQKPITCLFVSHAGDKLYSGSLDKTVKVWLIELDKVQLLKTHETKEAVQCLVANGTTLYLGAPQSSGVRDLDVMKGTPVILQQGVRTLLAKKPIHALQIYDDKLYSSGSCVDGVYAKVWRLKDKLLEGQVTTNLDVRAMVVNDEFVYLGSNTGVIEVWLRTRFLKVASMNIGCKVMAILTHDNVLYCGCEDGKIRRWVVG
ncbi:hypothetical protein L7F22_054227 [Adiantum nelumboides]|nr:hypothetical protein [Adiantum nelumboides]